MPLDLTAAQAAFVQAHELAKKGQTLEEDCSRWYYGLGVQPDTKRTLECAVRTKDLLMLSVLYANGEGVTQDAAKAEGLIRQALAQQRFGDAETKLLERKLDALHGNSRRNGGLFEIRLACADDTTNGGLARCLAFENAIAEGSAKRLMQATSASLDEGGRAAFDAYLVAAIAFYRANHAYLVDTYQGAPLGQLVGFGWEDIGHEMQTLIGYKASTKLKPADLAQAEAALSVAVQEALAYWNDKRNAPTAEGREAVKASLGAAQQAWMAFRDARVALNKALFGAKQGIGPVELDTRVSLTQARANEITRSLAQ